MGKPTVIASAAINIILRYSHQFIAHLREITNMASGFHEDLFTVIGFDKVPVHLLQ